MRCPRSPGGRPALYFRGPLGLTCGSCDLSSRSSETKLGGRGGSGAGKDLGHVTGGGQESSGLHEVTCTLFLHNPLLTEMFLSTTLVIPQLRHNYGIVLQSCDIFA